MLRFMFTDPVARQIYVDWEGAARRNLALFRASAGRYVGESWLMDLVEDLRGASPEFAAWWTRNELLGTPQSAKLMAHHEVGRLELEPSLLQVAQTPDLWMLVYTPMAGTATASRLQRLMSNGHARASTRPAAENL